MFNNKSILITGGMSSFGKRYVKTLLECYQPNRLHEIMCLADDSHLMLLFNGFM